MDRIAFALRMKPKHASDVIQMLSGLGFIEKSNPNCISNESEVNLIHNWSETQFESDDSAIRKSRSRKKELVVNVTGQSHEKTASDTDTDTDTDTEQIQKIPSVSKSLPARAGKTRCPDTMAVTDVDREWAAANHITVNLESVTEAMIDWAHSKGELRADWPATRRNFWRREQKNGGNGNGNGQIRLREWETKGEQLIRKQKESGDKVRELLRRSAGDGVRPVD